MGFLFPKIPKEHPALTSISANFVANILGLGWAATPAGLRAMSELAHLEEERGKLTDVASDEMCTFLVINISSLQLIPVNIIAYRSQYGSVNPAGIHCTCNSGNSDRYACGSIFLQVEDQSCETSILRV